MSKKIKEIWEWIVGFLGLAIAGVVYYTIKSGSARKEIEKLKAKAALAATKSKARELEKQILTKKEDITTNKMEVKQLDKTIEELEIKKQEIAKEAGAKTPEEIEQFWNN